MHKNMSRYLTFAVVIGSVCLLTYSLHVENKPFFATSIAATFLIHIWTRPGRRDLLLTVGIGLFLTVAYALSWPAATRSLSTSLVTGIAGLGLGSLAVTGAQAIWREGPARRGKLAVFLPSIVMAVSSIIVGSFSDRSFAESGGRGVVLRPQAPCLRPPPRPPLTPLTEEGPHCDKRFPPP